jgi:GH15 family glucan-1,4-alpha-glucosidase
MTSIDNGSNFHCSARGRLWPYTSAYTESRGGRQHFVHSKVMAWVAFDRAANGFAADGSNEPAQHWRKIADDIHADVCERGFDSELNTFVQDYGSKRLDASLLLIPLVGFLPVTDRRTQGTLRAIEDRLLIDGEFVLRYETENPGDGFPPGEGALRRPQSFEQNFRIAKWIVGRG